VLNCTLEIKIIMYKILNWIKKIYFYYPKVLIPKFSIFRKKNIYGRLKMLKEIGWTYKYPFGM